MRVYRFLFTLPLFFLFTTLTLLAQDASGAKSSSGLDLDKMNKSVNPCENFYQYSCGNWLKTKEIPSDKPEWGSFDEVDERNKLVLKDILEKAAANDGSRTPNQQKIGDYYESCMDEKAANDKGIDPLKPELARIADAKDKKN